MQKRARNLAAEELLIEVMAEREWKNYGDTGVNIPFTNEINIKSIIEVVMFGWGSVFLLSLYKQKEKTKDLAGGLTKLFVILSLPYCSLLNIQNELLRLMRLKNIMAHNKNACLLRN